MNIPGKIYPVIGCCGLDCGLCPRYYTAGASRCPGCAGIDFAGKHPSCSFITCCVKKNGLEACGQCKDFPCPKFKSNEFYQQLKESSSYPSYKKVIPNLNFIKENGIEKFIKEQKKRIEILQIIIDKFNDGRSKSFFCRASCLLDIKDLKNSLDKASWKIKADNIDNIKIKAKMLKGILNKYLSSYS
ncbi:MAG: DUF3795 domain-containing protein [Actinobacteria bacterium]|nr:DUF3795 domain-containing protein [Actinomycetota bacterium]MBM3712857.1 DUF3795 domain-containing protein [Actinomycetota bacterium]